MFKPLKLTASKREKCRFSCHLPQKLNLCVLFQSVLCAYSEKLCASMALAPLLIVFMKLQNKQVYVCDNSAICHLFSRNFRLSGRKGKVLIKISSMLTQNWGLL